jgi:hypothetical protein
LFLSDPFISKISDPSRSSIDSLSRGVDSPDNIASFTIHVPRSRRRSHGIPESGFVRTTSQCHVLGGDGGDLRTLTRSPGTRSELRTSSHFPSRKAWTG